MPYSDLQAQAVHRAASVVLGYMNVGASYRKTGPDHSQFLDDNPRAQATLAQLQRGAVDVAVVSFGVPTESTRPYSPDDSSEEPWLFPVFDGREGVAHLKRCLTDFQAVVGQALQQAGVAHSFSEIEALNAAGKTAFLLHLTGAWCNGEPAVLQEYYNLGVRGIHLCVEGLNGVGDPSQDTAREGGLSAFGRELVREMNRLGMVVDIAHAADATAWQILGESKAPVISSHTYCRALAPGERGLPDDLMRAVAAKGGVVGLFLVAKPQNTQQSPRSPAFYQELFRRTNDMWQRYGHDPYEFLAHRYDPRNWDDLPGTSSDPALKPAMQGIETVIAHIDHAVQVAGIDHVGLGPDYEMGMLPAGLENAGQLANLTAALLEHGYSESDAGKLLGGNFMRVFREVMG